MNSIKDAIRSGVHQLGVAAQWRRKMEAFRVVYEKADRILSGHDVRVAMETNPPHELSAVPGWTDGEVITLNAALMSKDLQKLPMSTVIVHTKGMNYHELCHVMYTPRFSDPFIVELRNRANARDKSHCDHLFQAFNWLEDQRIETMFAARYRPSIPYFEAIALKWLINNTSQAADVFPLVYGRKFLPSNVRDAAEAAFRAKFGDMLADEAKTIIDEYLGIIFPKQNIRAIRLTDRMAMVIEAMRPHVSLEDLVQTADNGGARGVRKDRHDETKINKGNMRQRAQQEALEAMDDLEDEVAERNEARQEAKAKRAAKQQGDADPDTEDGEDGIENVAEELRESMTSTADQSGGDDADDDDRDDDLESGQGESEGSDASGDTEGPADDAEANGIGAGEASPGNALNPAQEATKAFLDALDDLFEDEEFMQEVADTVDAIQAVIAEGGEMKVDGKNAKGITQSVPSEVMRQANAMQSHFTRIRTALDEERHYRQTAGGVDVKRFVGRQPWEVDFFKTYDPGSYDEVSIDVVILADMSGSMHSHMGALSASLWAIKRSFEAVEGNVTVLGYSDDTFALYQPTERVESNKYKVFPSQGGTAPTGALKEALMVLNRSKASTKIMISLTDGQWWVDERFVRSIMSVLHSREVITAMCFLGHYVPTGGIPSQYHEIVHQIRNINELTTFAEKLVSEAMLRNADLQHV